MCLWVLFYVFLLLIAGWNVLHVYEGEYFGVMIAFVLCITNQELSEEYFQREDKFVILEV